MNGFRVDCVAQLKVPCGMTSIVYTGDDFREAVKVFNDTMIHADPWNNHDVRYGLILSQWDGNANDYVIVRSRGVRVAG